MKYITGFLLKANVLIMIFLLLPVIVNGEKQMQLEVSSFLLLTSNILIYLLLKRIKKQ